MLRKNRLCSLSQAKFRNYSPCEEPAEYRARATLNDGREFLLYLCPAHMPNAWELAQALVERRFESSEAGSDKVRLECISFHQINPSQTSIRRNNLSSWAA